MSKAQHTITMRLFPAAIIGLFLATVLNAQPYVPAFQQFRLENGLQVILLPDSTVPLVSLTIAYRAGSSRDPLHRTGTANIAGQIFPSLTTIYEPQDFNRLRRDLQAGFSAQTGVDWASITSIYPAAFLDSALTIEADRMAHAAQQLDTARFIGVRDRVRAETGKRLASPLGKVDMEIYHMLYPEGHPYKHLSTGEAADLDSIGIEDVRAFIEKYYCPANATLTIAGSVDSLSARALVEKYFASIPAGIRSQWRKRNVDVPALGTVGFVSEEYVGYHRLMMVFPTVPATHEDDAVLKLIGSLLAGGPNADLTYLLKRRPEVVSVEAYQSSQELAGEFWITVTCKVDTDLNKIYREIRAELARLANAPLSAEQMQAAKNATEFTFYLPVENLHGFGGRADLLNLGALLTGDPAFVFNTAAARQKLTANDIHSAVSTYLGTGNTVVVCVVPAGKKEFAVSF